ncbi:hypothetical protein C8Q74DRAFT_1236194 [Fomes fomentarius]|nr:hypothetical protein C8Q74DRAFT_1236194 [Fomes fomentarius]
MHPGLLFPGIYTLILEYVNLQFPDEDPMHGYHQFCDSNPTLASLARTCKAFLEPTLDVLWRSQRSLGPIIRTFPESVWVEEMFDQDNLGYPLYYLHLRRPPLASEWLRFDYYAYRVKEFGYLRFEFPDVEKYNSGASERYVLRHNATPQAVTLLCTSRRRHVLFPNLIRLRWNDICNSYSLPAFLSPTTTSLTFGADSVPWPGARSQIAMQLDAAPHTCPGLTELVIFSSHSEAVVDAAIRFAYRCSRLEGFVLAAPSPWPIELLQHLAALPFLRKVRLDIDEEAGADLSFLHSATIHNPFPSLQKLWITVHNLTPCIELIKLMDVCRLHTLDIDVCENILPAEVGALFRTLREHCALDTLQSVEITIDMDPKWQPDDADLDTYLIFEDLEPLLAFPSIRLFVLELHMHVELDNYAIGQLADAWPLLCNLRLGSFGFCCPTGITWAGLAYLVYKCPQLIFLCLPWDATTQDIGKITSLPDFKPHRHLRGLWASDSIIREDDVGRFAECIFSIAPFIQVLNGYAYYNSQLGIEAPSDVNAFYAQVETIMWGLRRTRMRNEFGFLDAYVLNEADMMNDFSARPVPRFPYVRAGRSEVYSLF